MKKLSESCIEQRIIPKAGVQTDLLRRNSSFIDVYEVLTDPQQDAEDVLIRLQVKLIIKCSLK